MQALVRVISVKDGRAIVEPTGSSGCGSCDARSACGVSALGKHFSANRRHFDVACDGQIQAGDELNLELSDAALLRASLLVYLLPCIFALIGAGLLTRYGDVAAIFGALLGIVLGWIGLRFSPGSSPISLHLSPSGVKGET